MRNEGTWSLRTRVTLAAACAAALGGVFGAFASATVARHMVEENENKRLLDVASDFAGEIEEELAEGPEDDSPEENEHFRQMHGERNPTTIVAHELEQLHYPAPRAFVRLAGGQKFGSANLPMPPLASCDADPFAEMRSCTVRFGLDGTLTLVVGTEEESSRFELFRQAMLAGALIGAAMGALASFFLARWTLLPLGDLRERIRQVDAHSPSGEVFSGAENYPTEVEELREAVASLVGHLAQALDQAKSFATWAAHELRTPLTALQAELDLLLEERVNDDVSLRRMKRHLHHLTSLIQRLLILASKPDRLASEGEAVELGELAEAVWSGLPPEEQERVVLQLKDEVYVRGDAELLRSLLVNGLSNALKFSAGQVHVVVQKSDETANLEVRDSGPGLSHEESKSAFLPYYRGPGVRQQGVTGYGIGLALIAHVAEIHGGKAYFTDAPVGACLTVELPRW